MDALRRPAVPEDVVQYQLFLVRPDPPKVQTCEQYLQQLIEKILAEFAPVLVQYIWQHQPFNVKYHPAKGSLPAHIGGSTNFGDNVEDEWFIVYLLREITSSFPELAARVQDNDGDFLLIEAADHLPKWLNPESSENRVFFYQGQLHILPIPSGAGDVGWPRVGVPSVDQALAFLSSHKDACLANRRVRSAVGKRLEGYPEKIQSNLHRAHCFVPAGVAAVLSRRPDLLAPAVSAFYLRDPLDLKACRTFHTFPPETRILTSVTFTRCLYAQLQQQLFIPDRRSGFTLPARSHPRYAAHELGMKLAHGFEILCSKCRLPSSEPDAPVSCNPVWKGFLQSLTKNDYFRGELEGSARYRELMASAECFFQQSIAAPRRSPGEEVLQVLQSCQFDVEELRKQEAHLPPEDSDSWLDISPQELERLLEVTAGCGSFGSNPDQAAGTEGAKDQEEAASFNLVAVTKGMKDFINTMSSHEGAELPWSQTNKPFSFDPDTMASTLERLLGGKGAELDSDDLDDDDDDDDDEEEEEEEEDGEDEDCCGGDGGPLGSEGQNVEPDGEAGAEALGSLRRYMEEMDRELNDTNIGQSFSRPKSSDRENSKEFPPPPSGGGSLEEEEEILPLDVDLNLVTNLLESLSSQAGLAGPASNLLQSMGIQLPPNTDRS